MVEKYFCGIPVAITVSDKEGKVVYMNDKSAKVFEKQGGKELLNKNLFDCHSAMSQEKIKSMMSDNSTNAYTIEKNGIKKIIFQTPWYLDNEVNGMVEFSFEIPVEMPHFKRN
jgi:transcriptional regulator with PAS, ATPase and Fis domain